MSKYQRKFKTHLAVDYSRNKTYNLCGRKPVRSRTLNKSSVTCGSCRRLFI